MLLENYFQIKLLEKINRVSKTKNKKNIKSKESNEYTGRVLI